MSAKIVKWPIAKGKSPVDGFIERPAFDPKAELVAKRVLADVKKRGDKAVLEYVRKFDGVTLKQSEMTVADNEFECARLAVSRENRAAIKEAHKRVAAFARKSKRSDWAMRTGRGGELGERFVPMDRVGVYVPGGAAPLVSTVLMTVTLAKVAGVKEIVAFTPCGKMSGNLKEVDPNILYALELAGATEVYKVGGTQAIAMMAQGTETVEKVQKIVGPGGAYVTAAKRQVYGDVALDLVAGPSEIAVLADSSANPRYIAADLLSQAEHGTGHERALLVTTSKRVAEAVRSELRKQVKEISRAKAAKIVIKKGMLLVVVKNLRVGMDLCNQFAPEHLELMVKNPKQWLKKVKAAGAVFVGPWSPEAVGDYVAGPSHVLPTGGSASRFSGLTVEDFRRRMSFIKYTRADLVGSMKVVEAFGKLEGLDAHTKSAMARFEEE